MKKIKHASVHPQDDFDLHFEPLAEVMKIMLNDAASECARFNPLPPPLPFSKEFLQLISIISSGSLNEGVLLSAQSLQILSKVGVSGPIRHTSDPGGLTGG